METKNYETVDINDFIKEDERILSKILLLEK